MSEITAVPSSSQARGSWQGPVFGSEATKQTENRHPAVQKHISFHLTCSTRHFRKVFLQISVPVYRESSNRSTLGEEMRVSGGSEQNLFRSFRLYNPLLMNLSLLEMSGCITLMVELDIVQAGRECY